MSSKITLDKDVKKQLDVRPLLPVIQSIRATRHCALTWSRSLHLHQAFRDSSAVAAEEVVFKTFPNKVRLHESRAVDH